MPAGGLDLAGFSDEQEGGTSAVVPAEIPEAVRRWQSHCSACSEVFGAQ